MGVCTVLLTSSVLCEFPDVTVPGSTNRDPSTALPSANADGSFAQDDNRRGSESCSDRKT